MRGAAQAARLFLYLNSSSPGGRLTEVVVQTRNVGAHALTLLISLAGVVGCGESAGDAAATIIRPTDAPFLEDRAPSEFNVLSYNVFLRPPPINVRDAPWCRAGKIGDFLADSSVDVAALQETFQPSAVSELAERAAQGLPYQVLRQPAAGLVGTSGGLSILSRYPIEEARTLTFSECRGAFSDCAAAKGAVHAVIRVSETARVNVVATHLDAGGSDANRAARVTQLDELRDFISEIDPATGPIIALGDFNIDGLSDDGEYEDLLAVLGFRDAEPPTSASTINCNTTVLCEQPVAPARLDYVFSLEDDRRLVAGATQHLPRADDECGGARYLSDHRAVWTTFHSALPWAERAGPVSANPSRTAR